MSFLCVVFKKPGNGKQLEISDKLSTLLCPYTGNIETTSIKNGVLYTSSIAAVDKVDATVLIPKGTQKNPQTSWAEISFSEDILRAKTDPMGTFPIWYTETPDLFVLTSEVKSLKTIAELVSVEFKSTDTLLEQAKRPANFSPYSNVSRVNPGAECSLNLTTLDFAEKGGLPLDYTPEAFFSSEEQSKDELGRALQNSANLIPNRAGGWGTYLSGGIDSSTATALLSKDRDTLHTYTLGTQFGDEYADAKDLADYLTLPHHQVFADSEQAISHFERAIFCNEVTDGLTAETLAQLSVLSNVANGDVANIVTGYGADLLFGSMLRHELYMQVTGVDDLQSLIERTCWSGEFSPFYAWSLGLEVHHLFWEPTLMNVAFKIPVDWNFDGVREKVLMRSLVVEQGIMLEAHAFRKKHAMTDGTQFNRVLSGALGLDDNYAYHLKTQASIDVLKKIFND